MMVPMVRWRIRKTFARVIHCKAHTPNSPKYLLLLLAPLRRAVSAPLTAIFARFISIPETHLHSDKCKREEETEIFNAEKCIATVQLKINRNEKKNNAEATTARTKAASQTAN